MRTRRQHSSSNSVPSPSDISNDTAGHSSSDLEHHTPVLLHETIQLLSIKTDDVVVDATLGSGGHAQEIVQRLGNKSVFIGIDADGEALVRAQKKLYADTEGKTTHFVEANFRTLAAILKTLRIQTIDKVLFDLGWSAAHLSAGRGFSFRSGEPLVMTYALPGSDTLTASYAIHKWSEESLRDILVGFGEEPYARRIAHMIVTRRAYKPFRSARDLADAIARVVPGRYQRGRIHPATRTFQALRIAVNDELGAFQEGFQAAWEALSVSGRIAVITFHSVEDRLVKNLMRDKVRRGEARLLVKRPVVSSVEERAINPRSRSAKLRAIEKTSM